MTTGVLPGHLTGTAHSVYPASVVSRAPAHGATKFSSASRRFGKLCSSLRRMNSLKWQVNSQSNQFVIQSIFIRVLINHSGHSCHIYSFINPLHLQNNASFSSSLNSSLIKTLSLVCLIRTKTEV